VWIKSEHCVGLLKVRFQCDQELRHVISSMRDLSVILQMIMCSCILHTILINHAIPEDCMVENTETEDDEELEQHDNERANRHNQILAYMMEMH